MAEPHNIVLGTEGRHTGQGAGSEEDARHDGEEGRSAHLVFVCGSARDESVNGFVSPLPLNDNRSGEPTP